MTIIQVECPKCGKPFEVQIESDKPIDLSALVVNGIECMDCFGKKIHAPLDVRAWVVAQLKAFPYAIVP